ncbi:MAG TPA: hypothetical protein VIZ00_01305 [Streptosporangiaceae bacterium]
MTSDTPPRPPGAPPGTERPRYRPRLRYELSAAGCTAMSCSVPMRGRPLRDRYVLRPIAVERLAPFLILGALAAALFLFARDQAALRAEFTRVLHDLQGALGGPVDNSSHGVVHDLKRLFAVSITNL